MAFRSWPKIFGNGAVGKLESPKSTARFARRIAGIACIGGTDSASRITATSKSFAVFSICAATFPAGRIVSNFGFFCTASLAKRKFIMHKSSVASRKSRARFVCTFGVDEKSSGKILQARWIWSELQNRENSLERNSLPAWSPIIAFSSSSRFCALSSFLFDWIWV